MKVSIELEATPELIGDLQRWFELRDVLYDSQVQPPEAIILHGVFGGTLRLSTQREKTGGGVAGPGSAVLRMSGSTTSPYSNEVVLNPPQAQEVGDWLAELNASNVPE